MELGEIGNFPGEGEFIYKRTKFCDGVYRVDMVDKTPLVRCRDCAHFVPRGTYKFENGIVNEDFCHYMRSYMTQITSDGFCKWGERKEVDE